MMAVILCAGFATRLYPLTQDFPKPLLPVAGRPVIDYMMDQDLPFSALGHVTKGELRIDDSSFGFISDVKRSYMTSLEQFIEQTTEEVADQ